MAETVETYKDAGVDIEAGELAVERMAHYVRATHSPQVLRNSHGAFGGLFLLDYPPGILRREYRNPVLVGCTDGVGTKLEIAFRMGVADTIGIDLVAMCVNDLIVQGAEPLFFLDYVAVGKLDPEQVADIVKGISAGCRESGCSILGGETAEMPGFYPNGHYELAGFSVGVVERARLIDGSRVRPGDEVVGLASSGIHSNGYSLVRRVCLKRKRWKLNRYRDELGCTLGDELLRPTRIYVRAILNVLGHYRHKQVVHAMAHITGGGLIGNIPRVLPADCDVVLRKNAWTTPPIFNLIQNAGSVPNREMYRVFNMGVGMVMVVSKHFANSIVSQLEKQGCPAFKIGRVVRGSGKVRFK